MGRGEKHRWELWQSAPLVRVVRESLWEGNIWMRPESQGGGSQEIWLKCISAEEQVLQWWGLGSGTDLSVCPITQSYKINIKIIPKSKVGLTSRNKTKPGQQLSQTGKMRVVENRGRFWGGLWATCQRPQEWGGPASVRSGTDAGTPPGWTACLFILHILLSVAWVQDFPS